MQYVPESGTNWMVHNIIWWIDTEDYTMDPNPLKRSEFPGVI